MTVKRQLHCESTLLNHHGASTTPKSFFKPVGAGGGAKLWDGNRGIVASRAKGVVKRNPEYWLLMLLLDPTRTIVP